MKRRWALISIVLTTLLVVDTVRAYPATPAVGGQWYSECCGSAIAYSPTQAGACTINMEQFNAGPNWLQARNMVPSGTGCGCEWAIDGQSNWTSQPTYCQNGSFGFLQAYTCPNGGTLQGASDCRCAAWQTDTGIGCVRTAGECRTYPQDTTTGCNKTTADMYATMPARTDLKYGFHNAQACVSKESCNARCRMDNCKWLEVLLPMHTGFYLRFERLWPTVVAGCDVYRNLGGPYSALACTAAMGTYHIAADLTDALTQHGCGTQADWDAVFATINLCPVAGGQRAQEVIHFMRDEARAVCLSRRRAAGKPDLFIEEPLRGQVCG